MSEPTGDVRLLGTYTNGEMDEPIDHRHYVEFPLTEVCETCDGQGKMPDFLAETFSPCSDCGSRGLVLSFAGAELLTFIREWGVAAHKEDQ